MKKNQKWILASILTILIAVSSTVIVWFIIAGNPPNGEPTYPDLTISDASLEMDYLTINITNIGDESTTSVSIIVKIDILGLILYNNSNSLIDLDVNEDFIFSINLTDFVHYFDSLTTYSINIQVDPNDEINETFENNNEQNIDYYYEEDLPPLPNIFRPNTYSLNCTIDNFGYAVRFNTSQVLLENSLNVSNRKINGYSLVNSTISENCSISNDVYQINVAFYGNQSVTINNLWDLRLNVVLNDNSSMNMFNSSIQNLYIGGTNDISLVNSSISFITTSQNKTFSSSLYITNSSIHTFIISTKMSLEFEYSSFQTLYILASNNLYSQGGEYLVSGTIRNCSIHNFIAFGQTNLDIHGTDIYQISMIGKTRIKLEECIITEGSVTQNSYAIFNKSKVLSTLSYGMTISSGSINLTNGVIEGINYKNTTLFINSNISKMVLGSIVVNNTGKVYISNFSCLFFAYDNANLVVNDTGVKGSSECGGYLEGNSKLIGINASFNTIFIQENSILDLSEECTVENLFANNSNTINIINCMLLEIAWDSGMLGARVAKIINSTIGSLYAPFPSKLDIINCSIYMLYEGISFQSGKNYLNNTGYFGNGVVLNSLNISNSMIYNRTFKYIEINGATEVKIDNLHDYINIISETGKSEIINCTLASLQMRNNARVDLNNCSTDEGFGMGSMLMMLLGPQAFICSDNSSLSINNSFILDGYILLLQNTAQVKIEFSGVYGLYIYGHSRAEIEFSELWMISISSSHASTYALSLTNSTFDTLSTIGWYYN